MQCTAFALGVHVVTTKLPNPDRQKRDKDDDSALLLTFQGFNMFSYVLHLGSLQNIATKVLATEAIQ
jgi:hypothetical protein